MEWTIVETRMGRMKTWANHQIQTRPVCALCIVQAQWPGAPLTSVVR
jgi:hypothetical protein